MVDLATSIQVADRICNCIPIVSTVTNISQLFYQAFYEEFREPALYPGNRPVPNSWRELKIYVLTQDQRELLFAAALPIVGNLFYILKSLVEYVCSTFPKRNSFERALKTKNCDALRLCIANGYATMREQKEMARQGLKDALLHGDESFLQILSEILWDKNSWTDSDIEELLGYEVGVLDENKILKLMMIAWIYSSCRSEPAEKPKTVKTHRAAIYKTLAKCIDFEQMLPHQWRLARSLFNLLYPGAWRDSTECSFVEFFKYRAALHGVGYNLAFGKMEVTENRQDVLRDFEACQQVVSQKLFERLPSSASFSDLAPLLHQGVFNDQYRLSPWKERDIPEGVEWSDAQITALLRKYQSCSEKDLSDYVADMISGRIDFEKALQEKNRRRTNPIPLEAIQEAIQDCLKKRDCGHQNAVIRWFSTQLSSGAFANAAVSIARKLAEKYPQDLFKIDQVLGDYTKNVGEEKPGFFADITTCFFHTIKEHVSRRAPAPSNSLALVAVNQ